MSTADQDVTASESSTEDKVLDVAAAENAEAPAESSAAQGVADDASLLDVVRDVVSKREPSEAAESPAAEEKTEVKAGEADPVRGPPEDYSDVPFHKHARFQELLKERNAAREDAGRYHNIQQFIRENGLADQEVADGFVIMALAKHNPAEAFQRIKPWVQKLAAAAGEILPENIQARVDAGELPHDVALELARTQARAQSMEHSFQFQQQQGERARLEQEAANVQNAAAAWERQHSLSDPDFQTKMPLLLREIAYRQATEGKPNTVDGVKAQLEAAYREVTQQLKVVTPFPKPKPAIKPVMGGQAAVNTTAKEPASTLDVVRQAVVRMRGG